MIALHQQRIAPACGVASRRSLTRCKVSRGQSEEKQRLRSLRSDAGAATVPKGADVVIIGGGVAGLSAARRLQQVQENSKDARRICQITERAPSIPQENVSFVLLEAGPEVGGRVRTDSVDVRARALSPAI